MGVIKRTIRKPCSRCVAGGGLYWDSNKVESTKTVKLQPIVTRLEFLGENEQLWRERREQVMNGPDRDLSRRSSA